MTPHYTDDHLTIYAGDVRAVLPALPAESVHCVVTSPPYWGLRDYGTAAWEGGDEACDHRGATVGGRGSSSKSTLTTASRNGAWAPGKTETVTSGDCRCGARRIDAQLGLEPTPEEYVANLVAIFREVRRVLRADGTVWLNLGSSYMAGGERQTGRNDNGRPEKGRGWAEYDIKRTRVAVGASGRSRSRRPERAPAYGSDGTEPQGSPGPGFACSDLCGGCRDALSSRSPDTLRPLPDGVSPQSLTGRDTEPAGSAGASPDASPLAARASTTPRSETPPPGQCSHCGNCGACLAVMRSPSRDARECARRSAYSDGTGSPSEPSAARTSGTASSVLAWGDYTSTIKAKDLVPIPWMVAMALQADGWYLRSDIIWAKPNPMPESVTDRPTKAHEYLFLLTKSARYFYDADAVREEHQHPDVSHVSTRKSAAAEAAFMGNAPTNLGRAGNHEAGRNLRSVWAIATQPYPGAHFATFPERLVEPCVKAGTSERGVCPECGAPWVRVVERTPMVVSPSAKRAAWQAVDRHAATQTGGTMVQAPTSTTIGWRPSCAHDAEPVPATVLDIFGGSGTTARVANRLGRRAVLIELNPDYIDQALTRNAQAPLGLVG